MRTCHLDVDGCRSRRGRSALRRDGGSARTGARRPRGRVGADRRPALRRPELGGRDRRSARARSTRQRWRRCERASRTSTSGCTACGTSPARRSRSAPSGWPRWGRPPRRARFAVDGAGCGARRSAHDRTSAATPHEAPIRSRCVDRRAIRSRARCSSTSTTRRSSCRRAGRSRRDAATGHARPGARRRWRLEPASTRSRSRSSATRSRRSPTRWRRRSSAPRTRPSSATGWTSPPSVCDAQGRTVAQAVTVPFHLGSVPAAMETLLEHYGERMPPGRRLPHERPVRRRHAPAGHLRLQARPPRAAS